MCYHSFFTIDIWSLFNRLVQLYYWHYIIVCITTSNDLYLSYTLTVVVTGTSNILWFYPTLSSGYRDIRYSLILLCNRLDHFEHICIWLSYILTSTWLQTTCFTKIRESSLFYNSQLRSLYIVVCICWWKAMSFLLKVSVTLNYHL